MTADMRIDRYDLARLVLSRIAHPVAIIGAISLSARRSIIIRNAAVMEQIDSVRTITATIAAELGETARGSSHYRVLFVLGTLLFAITFVVNLTADLAIRGIRKR